MLGQEPLKSSSNKAEAVVFWQFLLFIFQLYEDSTEMQMFFIKTRDELCRNGEVLLTPALSYTERHLQAALEIERMEKAEAEQREDEEKKKMGENDETPQETAVCHIIIK